MLDYTKVKEVFADKLAHDTQGTGRFESAFYHTMKYVYMQGVEDGERVLTTTAPLETIVGVVDGK